MQTQGPARSFIAIELHDDIRTRLQDIQRHLKASGADVKWVAPSNIHLTLKFLGTIGEGTIERVEQAMIEAASPGKPFSITLANINAFPVITHPQIIWVGVEQGKETVARIALMLEEKLLPLGFAKEGRPFAAHITLGRVRSARNRHHLAKALETLQLTGECTQSVRHITLFKSTLTPSGPHYEPLRTVLLGKE